MPFSALHEELVNDPVAMGYTGKSYQQMADLMNAPSRFVGKGALVTQDALGYCLRTGVWAAALMLLEDASRPVPVRAAAITFRDMLVRLQHVHTENPLVLAAFEGVLDALIGAGVMGSTHRSALVSIPDLYSSRLEELRGQGAAIHTTSISAYDIETALNETGD